MLREHLIRAHPERDGTFRWRGDGVSRIEGLSDAVFGFAVTLLVVSLEVPGSFAELAGTMRGFLAFAASFALLVMIWYAQYRFFRRYGLEDMRTTILNIVLLFVVLFYIYPLKFLFGTLVPMLWAPFARGVGLPPALFGELRATVTPAEWPVLMTIYGLGFTAIYVVFALMYAHAYRQRDAIALDALERLETRHSIIEHLVNVGIGVTSVTLALVGGYLLDWHPREVGFFSGMTYGLIGPAQAVHWTRFHRRRAAMLSAQGGAAESVVATPV